MAGMMRLGAVRSFGSSLVRTAIRGERRNINTSSRKTSSGGETCSSEKKNWISYGFSDVDPFIDRLSMHLTAFTSISLCLVTGSVYFAFAPDPRLCEWAQREGYLELRRRESQGLLPIDSWYIHPDKINLPTDEELGDTEIII